MSTQKFRVKDAVVIHDDLNLALSCPEMEFVSRFAFEKATISGKISSIETGATEKFFALLGRQMKLLTLPIYHEENFLANFLSFFPNLEELRLPMYRVYFYDDLLLEYLEFAPESLKKLHVQKCNNFLRRDLCGVLRSTLELMTSEVVTIYEDWASMNEFHQQEDFFTFEPRIFWLLYDLDLVVCELYEAFHVALDGVDTTAAKVSAPNFNLLGGVALQAHDITTLYLGCGNQNEWNYELNPLSANMREKFIEIGFHNMQSVLIGLRTKCKKCKFHVRPFVKTRKNALLNACLAS